MGSMNALTFNPNDGVARYLEQTRSYPFLTAQQEVDLTRRWREDGDREALEQLVGSHLRLVVKIARKHAGYGLPLADLISEGHVGLMLSVERYDTERGVRFATYAMWWIRASIQEYILRSWSLVKLGTTAAQKKLFFNLRKAKGKIGALEDGDMRPEHVEKIAHDLGVTETEVISMNRRMSGGGDTSLNAPLKGDGEGSSEWQDWLTDDDADQAAAYAEEQEMDVRRELLVEAMDTLNERERHILTERRLKDEPVTLEDLSHVYNVSRERIRQIEVRAFEKLQKRMRDLAAEKGMVPEPA